MTFPPKRPLPLGVRVVVTRTDGSVLVECLWHTPAYRYEGLRPCPECARLRAERRSGRVA